MFIEKSLSLLKDNGYLGFIIPDTLLTNKYFGNLRRHILEGFSIKEILDLRSGAFPEAIVDTIIFILQKKKNSLNQIEIGSNINGGSSLLGRKYDINKIPQAEFSKTNNNEFNIRQKPQFVNLQNKMWMGSIALGEISNIKRGMVTKDNNKYVYSGKVIDPGIDKSKLRKLLIGKDAPDII